MRIVTASGYRAVLQHLHLFHGHKAAADHSIEHGQEAADLLLAVDDLDDQRKVLRQPQDLCRMKAARMSEAHGPAQNGGAGKMQRACLQYDRLVERFSLMLVVFADKDAKKNGVLGNLHPTLPVAG